MSGAASAAAAVAATLDLLNATVRIQQTLQKAQMEGRDITAEEWAQLDADGKAAMARLDAAIAAAQQKEAAAKAGA